VVTKRKVWGEMTVDNLKMEEEQLSSAASTRSCSLLQLVEVVRVREIEEINILRDFGIDLSFFPLLPRYSKHS